MKDVDKLLAAGAESVAGDLILNRKVVANLRNNQVMLTPEGVEVLASLEAAEDKPAEDKPADPAPRKQRVKKVEPVAVEPEPEPEVSAEDQTPSLDELLADE